MQLVMMGILDTNDNNTYKLAHISKEKLRKQKKLPTTLPCCQKLLEKGKTFIHPHVVEDVPTAEKALAADPKLLTTDEVKKESFQDTINTMIHEL